MDTVRSMQSASKCAYLVQVEGWKRVALTTQTTKYNDHQEDVFEGI